MTRQDAIKNIGHYIDDAMSTHEQPVTPRTTLVGWQCGFEPMFVAVNSYLDGCVVEEDEAVELATALLQEIKWFSDNQGPNEPDYVIRGTHDMNDKEPTTLDRINQILENLGPVADKMKLGVAMIAAKQYVESTEALLRDVFKHLQPVAWQEKYEAHLVAHCGKVPVTAKAIVAGSRWIPTNNGTYPEGCVQVHQTVTESVKVVTFSFKSGGFLIEWSVDKFLERYREVTEVEKNSTTYKLALFGFDDGPEILAFTAGDKWNGWGKPLVEKDSFVAFLKELRGGEDNQLFAFDGNKLMFYPYEPDEGEPKVEEIDPIEIEYKGATFTVYPVSMGLCWNQDYIRDLDLEDEYDVERWQNAHAPGGITTPPSQS